MVSLGRGCLKQEPRYDFVKIRTVNAAYRRQQLESVKKSVKVQNIHNIIIKNHSIKFQILTPKFKLVLYFGKPYLGNDAE